MKLSKRASDERPMVREFFVKRVEDYGDYTDHVRQRSNDKDIQGEKKVELEINEDTLEQLFDDEEE